MCNEVKLPAEMWNKILDRADYASLVNLSKVDKLISELAKEKLNNIKMNVFNLFLTFREIQARNSNLVAIYGKSVLLELKWDQKGLIKLITLKPMENNTMGLKSNQILISRLRNDVFGFRLEPQIGYGWPVLGSFADFPRNSISQNRLQITVESGIRNLHLQIAVKSALTNANHPFCEVTGIAHINNQHLFWI
jgi:hypothetical protein